MNKKIDDVRLALQWVQDLEQGDMIESRGYTRKFLFFANSNDAFQISRAVNHVLRTLGGYRYITTTKGRKIIPIER